VGVQKILEVFYSTPFLTDLKIVRSVLTVLKEAMSLSFYFLFIPSLVADCGSSTVSYITNDSFMLRRLFTEVHGGSLQRNH
jgi:hypothetical protein